MGSPESTGYSFCFNALAGRVENCWTVTFGTVVNDGNSWFFSGHSFHCNERESFRGRSLRPPSAQQPLKQLVQTRAVFVAHPQEFDAHPPTGLRSPHNAACPDFAVRYFEEQLHDRADWRWFWRQDENASQAQVANARDESLTPALPGHAYALRQLDARISAPFWRSLFAHAGLSRAVLDSADCESWLTPRGDNESELMPLAPGPVLGTPCMHCAAGANKWERYEITVCSCTITGRNWHSSKTLGH